MNGQFYYLNTHFGYSYLLQLQKLNSQDFKMLQFLLFPCISPISYTALVPEGPCNIESNLNIYSKSSKVFSEKSIQYFLCNQVIKAAAESKLLENSLKLMPLSIKLLYVEVNFILRISVDYVLNTVKFNQSQFTRVLQTIIYKLKKLCLLLP